MTVRNIGGAEVVAMLRSAAAKVPENARKAMRRGADRIVKQAKINCPVDYHDGSTGELEQSIHQEIEYEGRGRLTIDIVAGGVINGVDVDQYAAIIHENYESFKPGPDTIAKRAANPGNYVGGKFIERAVDDERPKLEKALIEANVEVFGDNS